MDEVKKVMAAVCFSTYCQQTFDMAVSLARRFDAKLVVANVINVRDVEAVSSIESMGYNVGADKYVEGIEEERVTELDKFVTASGFPKEKIKIIFTVGHPFEALMKIIDDEDVDLVVIGAKGRADIEHAMVGSVAEKLFRHSPVTIISHRKK